MSSAWTGSITAIKECGDISSRRISPMLLEKIKNEKELQAWPFPFRSVNEAWLKLGLNPIKKGDWRLTPYVLCKHENIPTIYGRLVCTDGIICVVQGEGIVHLAHLERMILVDVNDDIESFDSFIVRIGERALGRKKRPARKDWLFEEF